MSNQSVPTRLYSYNTLYYDKDNNFIFAVFPPTTPQNREQDYIISFKTSSGNSWHSHHDIGTINNVYKESSNITTLPEDFEPTEKSFLNYLETNHPDLLI